MTAPKADLVDALVEALHAMLSEHGRTVGQAWDDVPLSPAEQLARAAIANATGAALNA